MTFDPIIVQKRLETLKDYLSFLEQFKHTDPNDFKEDRQLHGSAERFAQLSMECIADICSYILARHFQTSPESYALTILDLGKRKVISTDLSENVAKMMQFRNILVHDYIALDRKLVHKHILSLTSDAKLFLQEISEWLLKHVEEPKE
ncbi:MAG: DUF86 domain-containing protein [Promethearchaeota archaeon]